MDKTMEEAHRVDHCSTEVTVAESRNECFIIGARNPVKSIIKICLKCRMLAKK